MARNTAAALVREVVRKLGQAGLAPQELLFEVSARVACVVPHDAAGWMTLDPDTLLPSTSLETSKSPELVRAMWRADSVELGAHGLAGIVRRSVDSVTMRQLDEALAEASPRVQVLRSAGIGDDLRAPLHAAGHMWGLSVLYRDAGSRPFNDDERAFMAGIAADVGDGLRRGLARRPAPGADPLSPGVVVFAANGTIASMTIEAERMARLMEGDAPSTLYAVAARAAASDSAVSRLRLADGRWLHLHGARLVDKRAGLSRTAVTLMPASGRELTSMLLRLHGLTVRERQVAGLLIAGHATDEIAAQLHISRHTLRDHVKAIFAKAGLGSRSQLMALVGDYAAPGAERPADSVAGSVAGNPLGSAWTSTPTR